MTKAIREEMKKDGTDYVWLSMEHIPKETILNHFPNIYEHCLEEGYDVTKEYIPVVPDSIISWVESGLIWIAGRLWSICMQLERQAAMVFMVRTAWQVIPFWKVLYLQNVQQQRSKRKKLRKICLNEKRCKMV